MDNNRSKTSIFSIKEKNLVMLKSWILSLLAFMFSSAILYYLFSGLSDLIFLNELSKLFVRDNALKIIGALLIYSLSYPVNSWRFIKTITYLKLKKLPLLDVTIITWSSHSLTTFLPSALVGDLGRAAILVSKYNIAIKHTIYSAILDRTWGIFGMIQAFIIWSPILLLEDSFQKKYQIIWLFLVVFIFCSVFLGNNKVLLNRTCTEGVLHQLANKIISLLVSVIKPGYFHVVILTGIFNSLVITFIILIVCSMVDIEVNIMLAIAISPLIVVVTNLPIFYHGFGGRELAFLYFHEIWGTTEDQDILTLSLIVGAVVWLTSALGLVFVPIIPFFKSR